MPNGTAIAQGENGARAGEREAARPGGEIPDADREHRARGSERQEAKKPRLKMICHRPGSIHSASRREAIEHDRQQRAGDAGRNELLGRRMDHLVGQAGWMRRERATISTADQDHARLRRSRPTRRDSVKTCGGGLRQRGSPGRGRQQRQHAGRRHRHRPIAAELGRRAPSGCGSP